MKLDTEALLSNSTKKVLRFEITKMLIAVLKLEGKYSLESTDPR